MIGRMSTVMKGKKYYKYNARNLLIDSMIETFILSFHKLWIVIIMIKNYK